MALSAQDGEATGTSNSTVSSMIDPIPSAATTSSLGITPPTSSTIPSSAMIPSLFTITSESFPLTTSSLATSIPAESKGAISTAASKNTSSARTKPLSAGAKAGIAIGTTAAVLLFILAVYLVCRRRRALKGKPLPRLPSEAEEAAPSPSGKEGYVPYVKEFSALYSGELPAEPARHELTVVSRPRQAIRSMPLHNDIEREEPVHDSPRNNDIHLHSSQTPPRTARSDVPSIGRSSFAVDPEDSVVDESQMTPAQLQELEEEERRIDAAIKESERLMELRRQREELQSRISAAKNGPSS